MNWYVIGIFAGLVVGLLFAISYKLNFIGNQLKNIATELHIANNKN